LSDFDELVARPGVLMAGRFGPDGRVAEHKTAGLYVDNPALTGIMQWFCAAVTTMFGSMAYTVDTLTQNGFSQSSWRPCGAGSIRAVITRLPCTATGS
jgi:roadblock/LC7 domain-containing protein